VRWLPLVATLLAVTGCPSVDPFACDADGQCVLDGVEGVCTGSTSRCAFPDDNCASGLRYPDNADGGLADQCVDPVAPATTSSTSANPTSSTGETVGSTTLEVDDPSSSEVGGSASTAGPGCTLDPLEPVAITDGTDIEVAEGTLVSRSLPAIRIEGSPNAVVRDLDVTFSGSAGIVISDSPGVVIERIRLHNAGAVEGMPAALGEIAILIERSEGAQIRDIFVEDARSGVVVIDSDDVVLERIWVDDVRGDVNTDGKGSDDGGDCVLLQTSERIELTGIEPHAGVFVDRCTDVVIEDGIAENIDQQSGAGVRIHTLGDDSRRITVRDFDVVGGTHACFDTLGGLEVTLENTGCRNQAGRGWVTSQFAGGPLRVVAGRYYNVSTALSCCNDDHFETFDVALDQFVPRLPPAVRPPCDL
jgi:hypothetical protein